MLIDKREAHRLKERYTLRTNAVFLCRLAFYGLYALAIFAPPFSSRFEVLCPPLWWILALSALLTITVAAHQCASNPAYGRWAYFLSLIFDLIFLATLVHDTGGLFSPVMILQPVFVIFFTLLFPNPIICLPPLLLLPLATVFSASLGYSQHFISELFILIFYGFVDGTVIYLTNYSIGREEEQTREILGLEKQLRKLSVLEERNRLARDLHDGVGAALSGLIIQAEYILLISQHDAQLQKEVAELKLCAEEAIDEVRRALSMMRDEFDLIFQLQNACSHFEARHKLPVHLHIKGTAPDLRHEEQLTLFRVMQECLTNAAKHAQASYIDVDICFQGGGFSLSVKDNGVGFDPSYTPKNHYGLLNMHERAKKIGAVVTVASKPKKGTEIALSFGN